MEIQIPSPSVFLRRSPGIEPAPSPQVKKPPKPRPTSTTSSVQIQGVIKPKQSKSRNGCLTCKKKRLKCDETKPSCQQCHRRNVECEGYRTTYKWRPFEETTFTAKPPVRLKKSGRTDSFYDEGEPSGGVQDQRRLSDTGQHAPPTRPDFHSIDQPRGLSNAQAVFAEQEKSHNAGLSPDSMFLARFEQYMPQISEAFDPSSHPFNLTNSSALGSASPKGSTTTYSSNSPQLRNLVLTGTDLSQPPDPSEPRPPPSPQPYQPTPFHELINGPDTVDDDGDVDEEVISHLVPNVSLPNRATHHLPHEREHAPRPRSDSSSSSKSSELTLYAGPRLHVASAEMLMWRFDNETCGILSVKDGALENPWRSLVWPLAQDSPALYHAISSMTAFHASNDSPELRMAGMKHMTKSIKELNTEISNDRLDVALATALTLAFSQGWDEHVTTGIEHLRGAKAMVNNAVVRYNGKMQRGAATDQDTERFKFLCNTFIYMDVIARLTSMDEDDHLDLGSLTAMLQEPEGTELEVDPLMGCASTLFPLIGGVAKLVQQVRKLPSNSPTIVSQAVELKNCIQQWRPPDKSQFEKPEDPHSEIEHSILTAEAYRLATLLHLSRAVPEIPSEPLDTLAKQVLLKLSPVPPTSRAIIVQIFPLLVASCEATDAGDREWVIRRWQDMIARMKIGNVNLCPRVVEEVWRRRDEHEIMKAERLQRRLMARNMAPHPFVPPMLKLGKRKAHTVEGRDEAAFLGMHSDMLVDHMSMDVDRGLAKRRLTMDATGMSGSMSKMNAFAALHEQQASFRRASDSNAENDDYDYSVRGRLHWLGVMSDWNWERR